MKKNYEVKKEIYEEKFRTEMLEFWNMGRSRSHFQYWPGQKKEAHTIHLKNYILRTAGQLNRNEKTLFIYNSYCKCTNYIMQAQS